MTDENTDQLVAIVNRVKTAHTWPDVLAALTEAAGLLAPPVVDRDTEKKIFRVVERALTNRKFTTTYGLAKRVTDAVIAALNGEHHG